MAPTIILYLTIAIIGIIALLTIYSLVSDNLRTINAAPSVLTSFGIFGTFLGITIGLFGFDPTNAYGSLPLLFDGIRLAFWTSVAGILGALLVKLRLLFRPGLLSGAEIARRDNRALMTDLVSSMQKVESGLTDESKSPLLAGVKALQERNSGEQEREVHNTLQDIREVLNNLQGSMTAASTRENAMLSTVQAMGETSAAALKEMQSSTAAVLREAQQDTAANIEALQHGTLGALQELQKETASSLQEVQRDSSEAIAALTSGSSAELRELQKRSAAELGELVKQSGQQFETLTSTLNGNQEALMTGLQASALLLDEFRNYRDDSLKRLQQLQDDIALNLASTMTSGVERIAAEFQDTMIGEDGVAARLAKEFNVSHEALAGALSQQNAANIEKLESIKDRLGDLGMGLSKDLHSVTGSTEVLAAAVGAQSVENLKKLDAVNEGIESIGRAITAELGAAIGAQSADNLKKLDAVNESIDAMGRGLSTDLGSVAGSLATLNDVNTGIASLTSQLGSGFNDLESGIAAGGENLAVRIMDTIDELRHALVGPDAGPDGAFNKFIAAQEHTQQALDSIKSALEEGHQQSDTAMAALRDAVSGFDSGSGAIIEAMRDAQTSSTDSMAKVGKAVEELNAGTMGLAKDMQKSQAGTIDELKGIRKAINDNTAKQQASPKALMKALEETVKQFNSQFSGQFWDKFGAFNESIGELIEWMETYRKQIADTLDHQTKAANNMDVAARRFDDVAQNAQMFTDISRSLGGLLTGIDSQRVEMESHLKRFSHIVKETTEGMANIETQIIEGNLRTNAHVEDISKRIEEQVIRLDHALDDELTKALNSFGRQLAALSEKFVSDYTPLTERLRDVVNIARAS